MGVSKGAFWDWNVSGLAGRHGGGGAIMGMRPGSRAAAGGHGSAVSFEAPADVRPAAAAEMYTDDCCI